MTQPATLLPEITGEIFPIRTRTRFRDAFGVALLGLHRRPAFARLSHGPWVLLWAIAAHWQLETECWPSQEHLARVLHTAGSRGLRNWTHTLERGGFVQIRRERRPDGSDRLYYAPGPVLLGELAEWVTWEDSAPAQRAKHLRAVSHPPERRAATSPPLAPRSAEWDAGEPMIPEEKEPSSSAAAPPATSTKEQEQGGFAQGWEELARAALAARLARKHPGRPLHAAASRGDVAMVSACLRAAGDVGELAAQTFTDAISGAFARSKDAPEVRYLFGNVDHYLDHAKRGRAERETAERAARPRPPATSSPSDELPRVSADVVAASVAELGRLLGWGEGSNALDP